MSMLLSCDRKANLSFVEDEIMDIADFIIENKDTYSTFYEIMILGDMKDPLNAYNPFGNGFTLFLPTDEAFNRFLENSDKYNSIDDLLNDVEFVRTLGRYHLVQSQLNTNQFPYGALPDTTASGDILTIGFSADLDTTIYKVNNVSPITVPNIELVNGIVHVISEVLEPVTYTGMEWLQDDGSFSILAGALELTGLIDTLGLYRSNAKGTLIKNEYTILAEHDSVFQRAGIYSLEDLVEKYNTPGKEYNDPENGLYQFAAYHILQGDYFLSDFEVSRNYNTLAKFPVLIETGLDIKINTGVDTFRLVFSETDTIAKTYISIYYQESNVLTKSGAIHFIDEVLELYTLIPRSVQTFQFMEEPIIREDSKVASTYEYDNPDAFTNIKWTGPKTITYTKSSGTTERALNKDFIEIKGVFTIEYNMDRILPGKYMLQLRADSFGKDNATVVVRLDGKRIGSNLNLATGGTANNAYVAKDVGIVELVKYSGHTIRIESLLPGTLIWDAVIFNPE
jgi:uncharacterized surface protein with fasciclin (FAS1) repeats